MKKKVPFLLAGRLERLFAYLIDTLLLVLPSGLVVSLVGTGGEGMLAGFMCNLAYFTGFISSPWQATPGQRLLAIQVVHRDGSKLDRLDALERFLAYTIPMLPMYASFLDPKIAPAITVWLTCVWFLPILIRADRAGMHDMLCGTRVIVGKAKSR